MRGHLIVVPILALAPLDRLVGDAGAADCCPPSNLNVGPPRSDTSRGARSGPRSHVVSGLQTPFNYRRGRVTVSPLRQRLIWLCAIVASLASRPAQAQDDPAQIVRAQEAASARLATTWLGSQDPRVRAWGAYLASQVTHHTGAPEERAISRQLIALAEDYSLRPQPLSAADRDEHDTMAGVLDALIQTGWGLDLPPPKAAALYPEFPAQALILLAHRQGLVTPLVWELVRREGRNAAFWLAGVNMLKMDRAPGLAGFLLAGLTIDARVTVRDEHPMPPGGGFGASCSGGGSPPPRAGWPSVGNYRLNGGPGTLVTHGVDPVFYTRSVGAADLGPPDVEGVCAWRLAADGNRLRTRLLANLAGESPDDPSVNSTASDTISWRGSAAFVTDLGAFVTTQETLVTALVNKLVTAGLLTPDDARTVRPMIELRIDDRRGEQTPTLPAVTDLPANVRVVK
jgi:hypothetical protein